MWFLSPFVGLLRSLPFRSRCPHRRVPLDLGVCLDHLLLPTPVGTASTHDNAPVHTTGAVPASLTQRQSRILWHWNSARETSPDASSASTLPPELCTALLVYLGIPGMGMVPPATPQSPVHQPAPLDSGEWCWQEPTRQCDGSLLLWFLQPPYRITGA